ncbi:hypothetical protein [Chitinophaga sp. Cy-1792]|uniref:hypothetical protein n=1 Tax=Chitinophaga sp. Cy-1792 TaxID=2608339 RepID=UPI001421D297|nr:hypothetical protein [Chitinophaga sp. Cy-1792]NIG56441.1 hypothetical protein [Chitinophaga sp. Cy-1792]
MKLIIVLTISWLMIGCTKEMTKDTPINTGGRNFFSDEIMANVGGFTTQSKFAVNVSQKGDTLSLLRIEGASNPSDTDYCNSVLRPYAGLLCNMLKSKNSFIQPTQFMINFQVFSPVWMSHGWDYAEKNFYYHISVSYKDYPSTFEMLYAVD